MKILLIIISIVIPIVMVIINKKGLWGALFLDGLAILSALIFGNIAATEIYEIIRDNTVFMTNIHRIFLNPLFLLTGGYLGLYAVYMLILQGMKSLNKK